MRSTSAGVIHVPRVRRMMWLNSWHRPPDRRRVDDRQELLEVVGEQPVEQRRVAVLERGEADVLLERVGLDPQVLELELDLLLDRQDAGREEAAQPERLALLGREREVLRQQAAAEQGRAGDRDAAPDARPRCRRTGRAAASRPKYGSRHGAPAARFPLARRDPRRGAVRLRPRCRGRDARRPPRDRPTTSTSSPTSATARASRCRGCCGCSTGSSCGPRSSSRAGSPRRGRTSPVPCATPATRSAITGTCTRACAASTRRPRRATCCAASRRSIPCSASGRSATGRRPGT